MPKVSVVVPNYNHARYLPRRLQSILDQTFQDFELIVLDDASADESLEVIARYAGDPRVRVIANRTNSGSPFKQWNRGVAEARAELVWLAESDDAAEPRLLEELVRRLDQNPSVGLAYCESLVVDQDGKVLHPAADLVADLDPEHWRRDFVASGKEECARYLLFKNTIPNASAVVFRKAVYLDAGGADESMRLCGDWHTWVGMLLRSDVAFVAEPLNHHRTHPAVLRKTTSLEASATEGWRVVGRILDATTPSPQALTRLRERLANEWASVSVLQQKRALDLAAVRFAELARYDRLFALRAGGQILRYCVTALRRRLRG